jgi:glycogen synthase
MVHGPQVVRNGGNCEGAYLNIFYYTAAFHPSVGGVERAAEVLCSQFIKLGHDVKLATETSVPGREDYGYEVLRAASFGQLNPLVRWCDIHIQSNISLYKIPLVLLAKGKVVFQHQSAYLQDDGRPSRRDRIKRRISAALPGIAVSNYVKNQVGCEYVIFNPYADDIFRNTKNWSSRELDIAFVGRLVSQKGARVLIGALERLSAEEGLRPRVTVVGDGPERAELEARVQKARLGLSVRFAGMLAPEAVAEVLSNHRFAVFPSVYEEPFGIVAAEALACGCVPIVSSRGGLVDAIGTHGLSFENGDEVALAAVLTRALREPEKAQRLLGGADLHLKRLEADAVARRYICVFRSIISERGG